MKRRISLFFATGFLLACLLINSNNLIAETSSDLTHRVFILHSYEVNHVCGQPQHDGIIEALKKAGFREKENLEIRTFFMDTKRKNNTPELMEKQACLALKEIRTFKPHVLVVLDDNAFRTVALKLVDSQIPIIFSGMNGQPEDYNKMKLFMESRKRPGHNITGVYEKLHILNAIKVHSKLFPGLKKVRFYVDCSPSGMGVSKQIKIEMDNKEVPCSWDLKVIKSWEEYKREIQLVNSDSEVGAIYPVALVLKDSHGNTYTAPEIFSWTILNSKKPEIAVNFAFTRMGLFGGAAGDFFENGLQAGRMVVRCLRGEEPGSISIEEGEKYALVFNLKRARQLGIIIPPDIIMAADEVISETQ